MGWNIREGKLSEDVFGEYFRGGNNARNRLVSSELYARWSALRWFLFICMGLVCSGQK